MISLKKVNKNDIKLLDNLLQLYLHDISEYFPIDFDSKTCKYKYDSLDKYVDESNNYAYLFMNSNDIIGFTLIDCDNNYMVVQEMFILNNYKNIGLGKECISKVFDLYRGNWIIKSLPASPKSENFWKKAIEKYTNNNYNLKHTGKYNRAEFTFNNEL